MITRRKRQYSPPVGLRMMSSSRDRIAYYMPSTAQLAPSVLRSQPVALGQSPQTQLTNISERIFANNTANIPQSDDTQSTSSPEEWLPDITHILELHQALENNQAMDLQNNLPLQPIDLADALSLREKETKSDIREDQVLPHRTARIQEVTPKQSTTAITGDKEPVMPTLSKPANEVHQKPLEAVFEKTEKSSTLDNSNSFPVDQPVNKVFQSIDETISAIDPEDTSPFETISEDNRSETVEQEKPAIVQDDNAELPISETQVATPTHDVANTSNENSNRVDLKPTSLNQIDVDLPVQFAPNDEPNIEDINFSSPLNAEQINTASIGEVEPDAILEKPISDLDDEKRSTESLFQPIESTIDDNSSPNYGAEISRNNNGVKQAAKVTEYPLNTPKKDPVIPVSSSLPIVGETQRGQPIINTSVAHDLSGFVQRQEDTEAVIPHPSSPDADLLKLLNLPPETPVVGLKTADTESRADLSSPTQVPTNNNDSEISRSILDSVAESPSFQSIAKPAENILSEIKPDTTKPNVNTEKLARRVFELLKDRLHREFERHFDNPSL